MNRVKRIVRNRVNTLDSVQSQRGTGISIALAVHSFDPYSVA